MTYVEIFRAVRYPTAGETHHHLKAGWQGELADEVALAVVRAGVGTLLRSQAQFESSEAFQSWQGARRAAKERFIREPELALVEFEAFRSIELPDGSTLPRGFIGLVAADVADVLCAAGVGIRTDARPAVAIVDGRSVEAEWEAAVATQRAAAAALPGVLVTSSDTGVKVV